MKITPQNVIFLFFVCGAFGVYDGEVKTVSVTEGDSVTLNPNVTEKRILWRFGSERIAEIAYTVITYKPDGIFRNRLRLDSETASLTITNMKMKHSGLFELEVSSSSSIGTTYKKFNVSVNESPSAIPVEAEMKSVSVTPGESLTLHTDAPDPHGDELIVWRFGDEGKLIAKADLEDKKYSYINTVEGFSDRLKLNNQNGSLTITNSRITDSGLYIVNINSSKQTLHKRFSVTVTAVPDSGLSPAAVGGVVAAVAVAVAVLVCFLYYRWKMGEEKKVTKTEGGSVDLFTGVTELHTDDEIQWWYGAENNLIAEITGGEGKTYDGDDERFSGKLTLDKKTGNLNISDIKIILSGLYKLKITRKRWIISRHKRFILTVNLNTVQKNVGEPVILSLPNKADLQEDQIRSISDLLLQEDDLILWKFGPQGSAIATFSRALKNPTYDSPDGRFKGKLNLDETGSLTITNLTTEHTGVYKLQLSNSKRTTNRKFRVIVTEKGGNESATSEKSPLNGE